MKNSLAAGKAATAEAGEEETTAVRIYKQQADSSIRDSWEQQSKQRTAGMTEPEML